MKTPEDEAFDDLARKQGAWGGGFPAKRAMAADKLQEPDWKTMPKKDAPLVQWAKEQTALQPTQEPMAWQWLGSAHFRKKLPKNADITAWNPLYTSPPQRPWVGLTEKDRIKYGTSWEKDGERIDPMSVYKEPVTELEALKLALEAYLCREMPAGTIVGDPKWWVPKIAAAIKEALAQPAQEPVAWVWNPATQAWEKVHVYGHWQQGAIYAFDPTMPPLPVQPKVFTTGHCQEKAKPGGCRLHNIHCGFPNCDRKKS